jgi:hypothetical protein
MFSALIWIYNWYAMLPCPFSTMKGQRYSVHVFTVHMHMARSSSCATRREWKKDHSGGCREDVRSIGHMILVFRKGSAGSNQPGKRSRNKEVYRYEEVEVFMSTYYVRVTRKILATSITQPAFVLAAETSATAHPKEPNGETPGTLQLFPLTCQLFAIHIIQPLTFIRTISP